MLVATLANNTIYIFQVYKHDQLLISSTLISQFFQDFEKVNQAYYFKKLTEFLYDEGGACESFLCMRRLVTF